MAFSIKICAVCAEEFELKPDKPGFANRCPECSAPESTDPVTKRRMDADERKTLVESVGKLAGSRVEATFRQDAAILGGTVVRIGSTVYDGSVRGRLDRLKEALTAG